MALFGLLYKCVHGFLFVYFSFCSLLYRENIVVVVHRVMEFRKVDIAEKKERILLSFREAFDKEMAYRKLGVTQAEKDLLDGDAEFQDRLMFILIEERERIIRRFQNLAISENEQVALKANTELGKMLYPEYGDKLKDPSVNVNINTLSPEEEMRINEEYGILLGGKEIFLNRKSK